MKFIEMKNEMEVVMSNKGIVRTFCSGRNGKSGEKIVELNKIEYFKNGTINKSKTLKNGYKVVKVLSEPYGFGLKIENLVEVL